MERTVWSDERIDDAVTRVEKSIGQLREEMREDMRDMRGEMRSMREEMHAGFVGLRRDMLTAYIAMSGTVVAALVAVLAKSL